MMMESIRSARPEDEVGVLGLLAEAGLPTDEVREWLPRYIVAEAGGRIVGVAGLEVHGSDGVLRSVVVDPSHRGEGLGGRLAATVIAKARQAGLRRLYLLTETAEDYFPRHGFRRVDRSEVSAPVKESVEFREACPDSAVAMVLDLG
ncbi:MAG: arsenic resistance N-acetyltransferase ArsN2 [Longimicrobiales bacterium]|nr:arsenic resistance N-acetyltransferase ArsN2 [Longimicrobiales bacterium]